MDSQEKVNICNAAWDLLRVETDGNCYSCSSAYVKDCYSFGNIFEDEIDEIWNGKAAQEFRKDKLEKSYKYCKYPDCHQYASDWYPYITPPQGQISAYPCVVMFSWDYSCSECCVFCRDKVKVITPEEAEKWESILHTKLIPLLKDTKLFEITGCGELFISPHSKKILKEVIKVYPDIKLKLFTNGIYCSKENLLELGIINNLYEVCVSLHSANVKTYKKIFKKDNFKKVINNILFLSYLKRNKIINHFNIQFVINKYNYKDIKKVISFANKINSHVIFTYVNDTTETKFVKNPYNWAIFKTNHYLYNDFVTTINDEYIQAYEFLPDFLKNMKKISKIQIIKNYFSYLIYLFKNFYHEKFNNQNSEINFSDK